MHSYCLHDAETKLVGMCAERRRKGKGMACQLLIRSSCAISQNGSLGFHFNYLSRYDLVSRFYRI